ncbi:MAG TPA: GNAT family N-acetyltransferase [Candidatus Dormibacteraeota bacterium]|nr:GNAT family N-acetyltransferase [Candidatus Dormibacteraeota bacterium]
MKTRRARSADGQAIHRLISHYADSGILLPRTLEEVQAHIDHFFLLVEPAQKDARGASAQDRIEDELLGCVALEPYGTELVEIRSLAVAPEHRGRGLGAKLLHAALAFARRRKFVRVFAVTAETEFFLRQGFSTTERTALAEKIERDCRLCPKQRTCKLVAVVAVVSPKREWLPIVAELTAP